MLKEIHEQADAVAETVADRVRATRWTSATSGVGPRAATLRRIFSWPAAPRITPGLIGRYAIEGWARVPVEIDIASEFRYRNPVLDEHDLVVGISQSGETADTLAAMRLAREKGAKVLGVTT